LGGQRANWLKGKQLMTTETDETRSVTVLHLAQQVLDLEQRLSAYQVLYEDEIGQIRRSLDECRKMLLMLLSADGEHTSSPPET
jgi:hypothetical protein